MVLMYMEETIKKSEEECDTRTKVMEKANLMSLKYKTVCTQIAFEFSENKLVHDRFFITKKAVHDLHTGESFDY